MSPPRAVPSVTAAHRPKGRVGASEEVAQEDEEEEKGEDDDDAAAPIRVVERSVVGAVWAVARLE